MSRLDKKLINSVYEVEIDPPSGLPVTIHVTLLTGRKGETKFAKTKIVGGRHVVFEFEYKLSGFGEAEKLDLPREASRLLARGR